MSASISYRLVMLPWMSLQRYDFLNIEVRASRDQFEAMRVHA
jgi:hypothetical protein